MLTNGCGNSKNHCVMKWESWKNDLKACQVGMLNVSNRWLRGGMNAQGQEKLGRQTG